MNIVYIDHYAGSDYHGMEFRPYYLSKEWLKMGHHVTIIAADYSHLRKVNPTTQVDWEESTIEGVDYNWVKVSPYEGNGLKRILSMVQFVSKISLHAKEIAKKYSPDVVICSSTYPFDTYAGQRIKKYSNAKLIHEVHDLWPLTPMELGGYSKYHPFIKIMQIAEKSAYKKSALIVSILPNIKPYVASLNLNNKIVSIPNGIVLQEEASFSPANQVILDRVNDLKKINHFVIGYAGGISVSNAMWTLLETAELLKDEKISFIIIGSGIEKEQLVAYKETHKLDNVHFFDAIDKGEVHRTLQAMDALYLGSKKSHLYEFGVSANKIFDYMLTGKPIINAFDSKHSPLNYFGDSFVAEAENALALKNAIERVMLLPAEELQRIKIKSIEYVKTNHNYPKLADDFAKEFYNEL